MIVATWLSVVIVIIVGIGGIVGIVIIVTDILLVQKAKALVWTLVWTLVTVVVCKETKIQRASSCIRKIATIDMVESTVIIVVFKVIIDIIKTAITIGRWIAVGVLDPLQ